MAYAFILGRNPDLSIAELGCFFSKMEVLKSCDAVFVENLPDGEPPQKFLNRLGGCTEILEIIGEHIPVSEIEPLLTAKLREKTGKVLYAVDIYPAQKSSKLQKFLITNIKKRLREKGIHGVYLNKNFRNVSDVAAVKQGLIKKGTKFTVIEEGEGMISVGISVAIQDFESYAKRDYGKPFRDPAAGMLPPKLAQIMLNLAVIASAAKQSTIILDPFCGTGTILMETMLMRYSVIGSDKDAKIVSGAQKNIDWLQQMFPSRVPVNTHVKLFQKDATALIASDVIASKHFSAYSNNAAKPQPYAEGWPKQSSFAVVTEPYLGPPLSAFPAPKFLEKLTAELEKLYVDFFANSAKWLPKGTPVVFIFPYWKSGREIKQRLAPLLIAKIEALGYSKSVFAPLQKTSLLYDRPDSVVGREIVRFVKNGAA